MQNIIPVYLPQNNLCHIIKDKIFIICKLAVICSLNFLALEPLTLDDVNDVTFELCTFFVFVLYL